MEIKIKGGLLNNAPLNSNFSQILCEDYEKKLDRITDEIKYGAHKNYLVTGYRGVGKTSIIHRLKEKINKSENIKEKTVFLELNLFDSHDHIYILKNMIRKLYLGLDLNFKEKDHDEYIEKIIRTSKNLYIQTFVEISKGLGKENSIQKSTEIELEVVLKNIFKIFLVLALFFLPVNISNKLGSFVSKSFLKISISLFLLRPLFKNIKIKKSKSKIESQNSNFDFKEILDEDTYDYYLKEILKDLSKNKIKIIIILDELDKIKDVKKIETIFDNLKSVMLSNLATFIIIPGQELFYHLNNLKLEDNSYLDSLFSKNIHVSTLNKNKYESIFKALLVNEKDLEKIEVKEYLNNMYINSFGIIRKFFQNLNKEIIWEKEESYINVKRKYKDTSNSKILECFDDIYEDIIAYNFPEPLEEYYKIQLYIWINKMKGKISFTAKDILSFDESNDFQLKNIILNENLNNLLEKLINFKILEKEGDSKYSWKKDIDINIKGSDFETQIYAIFIRDFINFEKMIRNFYSNLYKKENLSLKQIIMKFSEDSDFKTEVNIEKLLKLIIDRNNIVHGAEIGLSERAKFITNSNSMKEWIHIFIENYFYMLLKKDIIKNDWNVSRNEYNVDLVLEKQEKYILFEFKYISSSNANTNLNVTIKNMISKFIKRFSSQNIKKKVILIIFIEEDYNIEKFVNNLMGANTEISVKIFKVNDINEIIKIQNFIDESKNSTS